MKVEPIVINTGGGNKVAVNFAVGVILITLIALFIYIYLSVKSGKDEQEKAKAKGDGQMSKATVTTLQGLSTAQKRGTMPLTDADKKAVSEMTKEIAEMQGITPEERLRRLKLSQDGDISTVFDLVKAHLSEDVTMSMMRGEYANAELAAAGMTGVNGIPEELQVQQHYIIGSADDPYLQVLNGLNDGSINPELAAKYGVMIPGYDPSIINPDAYNF